MQKISQVVRQDIGEIVDADIPWEHLKGSRVLVTGATGMIPSYVVLALLEANARFNLDLVVYALARNGDRAREAFEEYVDTPVLELVIQDVVDPLPDLAAVTHIIHGASAAQPSKHASDPAATLSANILGTRNLLEAARVWGVQSFALMSSAEVYGDTSATTSMISENDYGPIDLLNPRACYSEGKRASETYAAVFNHQFGIPYTAARFGHIFGPGLALDDGRVQADFASDVVHRRDITLKSAGLAQRTYTYLSDAVTGLFVAMLRGESGAYNVSAPEGLVSIRGLAQAFVDARPEADLSLKFSEKSDEFATNKVQFQGLDSSKLQGLGWSPEVSLEVGIDRFLRHFEEG